ncbi:MAG TPA: hypothetical protein VGF97_19720 [Rhizomicrobium sp.]|jgi:hypothetical protein
MNVISAATTLSSLNASAPVAASPAAPAVHDGHEFLSDMLDVLNPLQHIPVVATLYRAVTHDTIDPVERVVGDTLYGGLMGLASSVGELVFQKLTGKDLGDTVLAFLGHGEDTPQRASDAYRQSATLAVAAN